MSLAKSLNYSVPQFPHLENGGNNVGLLWGWNEFSNAGKVYRAVQAHNPYVMFAPTAITTPYSHCSSPAVLPPLLLMHGSQSALPTFTRYSPGDPWSSSLLLLLSCQVLLKKDGVRTSLGVSVSSLYSPFLVPPIHRGGLPATASPCALAIADWPRNRPLACVGPFFSLPRCWHWNGDLELNL